MTRAEILRQACVIVNDLRKDKYGKTEDNFGLISALWSDYVGERITPTDVAMMMAMLKIARAKTGKTDTDNFVDGCGYMACAGEIATERRVDE